MLFRPLPMGEGWGEVPYSLSLWERAGVRAYTRTYFEIELCLGKHNGRFIKSFR